MRVFVLSTPRHRRLPRKSERFTSCYTVFGRRARHRRRDAAMARGRQRPRDELVLDQVRPRVAPTLEPPLEHRAEQGEVGLEDDDDPAAVDPLGEPLHVVAETLKSIPSGQLLIELPGLVAVALPSLSSEVVDLRKAVIFVLVEAYMVVGDALYPLVKDLAPPQKKLLTIYIDRALSEKKSTL